MPAHSGINADRLRRYPNDPVPGQAAEQPDAEEVDGEDQWEVDKIVASRLWRGRLQYQADWKGYDPDPEWHDAANFKESPFAVRDFHAENPSKAGPPLRLQEWITAAEEERFLPPHADDNKAGESGIKSGGLRRSIRKVRGK